jgi:hypothetical protein
LGNACFLTHDGKLKILFQGYIGLILDSFDSISQTIKVHSHKAQILLEVKAEGETLEKALSILKDSGIPSVKYDVLREEYPLIILIFLSSDDMREAVLKLMEAGFTQLKGINPRAIDFKLKENS